MIEQQLREKLADKLVDITCQIDQKEIDKKTFMAAYSELIKSLERQTKVISKALKKNDDTILIDNYGEFYQTELGLK
jgi:Tfp pilus assembly protein PilF